MGAAYDEDAEAAVVNFARSYDGYAFHGGTPQRLEAAVSRLLGLDGALILEGPVVVEEIRAALFAVQRASSIAGKPMTSHPATFVLLERLREMHPEPLLQLSTFEDVVGFRPGKDTREDWLLAAIPDLVRLALLVLPDRVNRDQLAWLGLTSKPELALRDHLGWLLQQSLPAEAAVAREWRRFDLAVLVKGEPRAVIEGKAIYGFDALNPNKLAEYVGKVEADLVKGERLAPNAFTAAIVSVTTPISEWLPASNGAIGYAGNRRTAVAGVDVLDEVSLEVHRGLRQLGQVAEIPLGTGVALGAQVATSLFFVRPTRGGRALL